jgi:hypothetical protein
VLLVAAATVFGCGGGSGRADDTAQAQGQWVCGESSDGTSCSCDQLRPDSDEVVSHQVDSCLGLDLSCCLMTNKATDFILRTCECVQTSNCQAEAQSRTQTTVVATCPPDAKPPACAAMNENCRFDYLQQNELAGCCEGTLCRADANGVPVCQTASDGELAENDVCTRASKAGTRQDFTVTQPSLVTSVGNFTFDGVEFAFLGVGPGGCLNGIDMTFSGEGGCTLELKADVANGALVPNRAFGLLSNCSGYSSTDIGGGNVVTNDVSGLTLDATGIACDGGLIFESYCFNGHFDWHFDGQLGDVTFSDQHLVAEGVVCSAQPMGQCPTQ